MSTEYYVEFAVRDNNGNDYILQNVTPYNIPNSWLNAVSNILSCEELNSMIAERIEQDLIPDILEIVRNESQEDSAIEHPKLTVTEFDSLPSKRFSKAFKNEGFKQSACTICGDEFRSNQKLPVLECGHHFHWKCLKEWVTKHRAACPVCMGEVKAT